jgi:predicted nucleotidyltransferase
MDPLPAPISALADRLAGMPGARAVVLGGSRATGAGDAHSDWDLAVYYRGALDTAALAELGEVYPPGRWGRIMNGGAWLQVEGIKVDVLLRDLDVVEHWAAKAEEGIYEIDALLGYVAGLPTYSLRAELASCRVLRGTLAQRSDFPEALAKMGAERWRFHVDFTLHHADMRADRGDVVGAAAQAAKAAIERAHELLCARRTWALNEKRILERAGLAHLHRLFAAIPQDAAGLGAWVREIRAALA